LGFLAAFGEETKKGEERKGAAGSGGKSGNEAGTRGERNFCQLPTSSFD